MAAGNRSAKASVVASTSPCADTQPPSAPTGLAQSVKTETSVGLTWQASTDNFGVTGYGVYQNGVRVAQTASPTFTFASLTCGTSYTVAVDAYDGAGNRSTQTTLLASTSACPPPSGTTSLSVALTGSDSNACTAAAPCKTFDRAYRAAAPGQFVGCACRRAGEPSLPMTESATGGPAPCQEAPS